MKNRKKLIHFLSFALVNIFLINTCVQTFVSEVNLRNNKISQHQTAKKADTAVVEEDNENEDKPDVIQLGDITFFLQTFLIADHHYSFQQNYKCLHAFMKTASPLFLKNRIIRI
ncbi:MAG: hypothetical protein WCR21_08480 [Bacteroidota bacterium]